MSYRNDDSRLVETIRTSVIGDDQVLEGHYANTHTETSGTGLQTTRFREDARAIIHAAVGGGEQDCVIFCGSGATSAINKLVDVLNLRLPADLAARYQFA